jgi:hypothetical protein
MRKGWSKAVDGGYQVTEEGKKVRQDAEDQTDRYYYAAWDALSANEVAELGKLLTALRDQLKALLPESEEETT